MFALSGLPDLAASHLSRLKWVALTSQHRLDQAKWEEVTPRPWRAQLVEPLRPVVMMRSVVALSLVATTDTRWT